MAEENSVLYSYVQSQLPPTKMCFYASIMWKVTESVRCVTQYCIHVFQIMFVCECSWTRLCWLLQFKHIISEWFVYTCVYMCVCVCIWYLSLLLCVVMILHLSDTIQANGMYIWKYSKRKNAYKFQCMCVLYDN